MPRLVAALPFLLLCLLAIHGTAVAAPKRNPVAAGKVRIDPAAIGKVLQLHPDAKCTKVCQNHPIIKLTDAQLLAVATKGIGLQPYDWTPEQKALYCAPNACPDCKNVTTILVDPNLAYGDGSITLVVDPDSLIPYSLAL